MSKKQWLAENIKEGEIFAGIILGNGGENDYHLVLLPGEVSGAIWSEAKSWALEQGGELPNRRELLLLWVNAAEEFAKDWYWSGEQHAVNSHDAWSQNFGYGYQNNNFISIKLRARAVRRIYIGE